MNTGLIVTQSFRAIIIIEYYYKHSVSIVMVLIRCADSRPPRGAGALAATKVATAGPDQEGFQPYERPAANDLALILRCPTIARRSLRWPWLACANQLVRTGCAVAETDSTCRDRAGRFTVSSCREKHAAALRLL
jgi:hypothetical protein